jgi:hypothetical protein
VQRYDTNLKNLHGESEKKKKIAFVIRSFEKNAQNGKEIGQY